jgi:NADH dehydrogenase/NADH:ubiquinone oxidoreductase subunit G
VDAELYGDYEKLLRVSVLGRDMEMPENNTLLRGLQFAAPQTIPYGRFCWNGTCNNCTVTVRSGACESKALACRMDACDGMQVTSASREIQRLL